MRTFSLIKGLPVYNKKNGEKLGEVCDLSISLNGKVKGLLLRKGAFLKRTFLIPMQGISSIGFDGVMVEDESRIKPINEEVGYTLEGHHNLTGKAILSTEGEKLGLLEDVYFHEELGRIIGYECSDGFFSDISEGKRVIKTDDPPMIGKDAIIVNVRETMN